MTVLIANCPCNIEDVIYRPMILNDLEGHFIYYLDL